VPRPSRAIPFRTAYGQSRDKNLKRQKANPKENSIPGLPVFFLALISGSIAQIRQGADRIRLAKDQDNNDDQGNEAKASANIIDIGQNGRAWEIHEHGSFFQF
jgi:hypothetical protein